MWSLGASLLGTVREREKIGSGLGVGEQTEANPAEGTYGLGHVQFSVNKGVRCFQTKGRKRRRGARVLKG